MSEQLRKTAAILLSHAEHGIGKPFPQWLVDCRREVEAAADNPTPVSSLRGEVGDLRDQRNDLVSKGIDPNLDSLPWRPIAEADNGIAYIHDLVDLKIGCSYPIWVRDENGRVYEALWSDNGKKAYWWDIEGESPVDPVEFMPHPLAALSAAATEGDQ